MKITVVLSVFFSTLAAQAFIGNLDHKPCSVIYQEPGGVVLETTSEVGGLSFENCEGCDSLVINRYFAKGIEKLKNNFGLKDQETAAIYDFDNNCSVLIRTLGSKVTVLGSYGSSGGRGGVSNTPKSGGTTGGVHRTFLGSHEEARIASSPLNMNLDPGKTGYVAGPVIPTTGLQDWVTDFVLTRFIRLRGLEPALNSTASDRKILFHGTHEEGLLDFHESAGCIRLANHDMVEFYRELPLGSLVNVVFSDRKEKRNRIRNRAIPYNEAGHPGLVKAGRK